jgi:hypothetical protein
MRVKRALCGLLVACGLSLMVALALTVVPVIRAFRYGLSFAEALEFYGSITASYLILAIASFAGARKLYKQTRSTAPEIARGTSSPRERIFESVLALIAVIASYFVLTWANGYATSRGAPGIGIMELLFGFLLSGPLLTLVHELGHVSAAWLAGLQFVGICVGPLLMKHNPDGWRFQVELKKSWFQGYALGVPKTTHKLRGRLITFISGGPVASLLFGLVCTAFFLRADSPYTGYWAILGYFSCIVFATALVPHKIGGQSTDGFLLLQLLRNTPNRERMLAGFACSMTDATQLRPKDWNPEWILARTAIADESREHMGGCYHAYLYHLDRGEIEDAGRALDRLIELLKKYPQDLFGARYRMEAAYFEARHRKNADAARESLALAGDRSQLSRYSSLRVQAAVLAFQKDREKARELIRQAEECLANCRQNGFIAFEKALVEDLKLTAQLRAEPAIYPRSPGSPMP